jgi:hypothetical protein
MAFNAEFRNRSNKNGRVSESLYSVIDDSFLGHYESAIVGAGKGVTLVHLNVEGAKESEGTKGDAWDAGWIPSGITVQRYSIRSASDLVSHGRSLLRKVYRDYKGEGHKNWSSPEESKAQGKTSESGQDAVAFGELVKED